MDYATPHETQDTLCDLQRDLARSSQNCGEWEMFYRKYNPFVRATIINCGVTTPDLEDRAQEAWIELLRCLPQLELDPARGSLRSWIRTVVFRVTRDTQRRMMRSNVFSNAQGFCEEVRDPAAMTPPAECERREAIAKLKSALNRFRDQTSRLNYEVLQLVSMKGLTAEETGTLLKLSVPQVWARHHRVKRHFQRFLRASGIF